jgi:hypothetical protein
MFAPTETDRTAEQAKMLMPFGFTERQARFLVLVLLHSGVFMGRQYAAFAGITHGQKVHDFVERLLARRFATAHRVGRTGRTRLFHVQHKPLYAALGEPACQQALDEVVDLLPVRDAREGRVVPAHEDAGVEHDHHQEARLPLGEPEWHEHPGLLGCAVDLVRREHSPISPRGTLRPRSTVGTLIP